MSHDHTQNVCGTCHFWAGIDAYGKCMDPHPIGLSAVEGVDHIISENGDTMVGRNVTCDHWKQQQSALLEVIDKAIEIAAEEDPWLEAMEPFIDWLQTELSNSFEVDPGRYRVFCEVLNKLHEHTSKVLKKWITKKEGD